MSLRCVWRHTFGTRRWRSVTRSRGIIDVVGGDESGDDVRGRWVAPHSLTHGVCMVLCAEHRSDGFQCLREGHVFASELAGMRRAAGVLATCHRSALTTHLRRIGQRRAMMRARRGSSSWPWLRAEAQRRFAAGESPRGIHDLRASYAPVVHRRQVAGAPRIRRPGPDVPVEVARAGRRRVMRPTEIRDLVASLTEPQSWRGFGWPRGPPEGSARSPWPSGLARLSPGDVVY